jgi:hypothetical protein
VASLLMVASVVLAVVTNVSTQVDPLDDTAFRYALGLKAPKRPATYAEEIGLIRAMQRLVLERAPVCPGIPEYEPREPADLLRAREGLCYDRSRTFDKLFSWYGLKSRHVYILYTEHPTTGAALSFWRAFFTRGTQSHAVTEVKTRRGWVVVDSNSPWISVTRNGDPVSADAIPAMWSEFSDAPSYFNRPYFAIRGMYSRRGQFYRPYIPFPQMNWPDLISWLVEDKSANEPAALAQRAAHTIPTSSESYAVDRTSLDRRSTKGIAPIRVDRERPLPQKGLTSSGAN